MADSPLISVDLSKAFHPRHFELHAPLLPGLFVEGSVFLLRPEIVWDVAGRMKLDRYGTLASVAVLAAFLVGSALTMWVRLIEIYMLKAYRLGFDVWPRILERLVAADGKRRTARQSQGQTSQRQSIHSRSLGCAWRHYLDLENQRRSMQEALGRVTVVILRRHGIDDFGGDLFAWGTVIGTLRARNLYSPSLVIALTAVGWGGLIVQRFVPGVGGMYTVVCNVSRHICANQFHCLDKGRFLKQSCRSPLLVAATA